MLHRDEKSEHEIFLEYVLRKTKGRIRLISFAHATLIVFAATAAFLLLEVLFDHLLNGLDNTTLLVLRCCLLAMQLGIMGCLVAYPLFRRISDLYVVRVIEHAYPEFRNDLTSALQLPGDARVAPGIVSAVQQQAAHEVAQSEFEQSVSPRKLLYSGLALAGVCALFLFYAAISAKPVLPSLLRALGRSLPPPTVTRILSLSPAAESLSVTGQSVPFSAVIFNATSPAVLEILSPAAGGADLSVRETLAMKEIAVEGKQQHCLAYWNAVAGDENAVMFRVVCGDAATSPRLLRVLPRPAIRKLQVRVDWPGYTRRGSTLQSDGRIEAVAGSKIALEAQTNLPMSAATLLFDKSSAIRMQVDGADLRAEFTASVADRYRIGYKGVYDFVQGQSIAYDVDARPDAPPTVQWIEPGAELSLGEDESLRLSAEASDDFGLAGVTLVVQGRSKQTVALAAFRLPGPTAQSIERVLPVRQLGRAGDKLLCHLEACDFRPPEGQVGRSRDFKLTIQPPSEQSIAQEQAAKEAQARQQAMTALPAPPTPKLPPGAGAGAGESSAALKTSGNEGKTQTPATPSSAPADTAGQEPQKTAQEILQLAKQDSKSLEIIEKQLDARRPSSSNDSAAAKSGEQAPGASPQQGGQDGSSPSDRSEGNSDDKAKENGGKEGQKSGQGEKGPSGGDKQGEGSGQGAGAGQGQGQGEGEGRGQGAGAGQGGQGEGSGQGESSAAEGSASHEGGAKPGASGEQAKENGKGLGSGGDGRQGEGGNRTGQLGGDVNAGSSTERGEVAPQGGEFKLAPRELARLQSVGRAITELQNELRSGEAPPELLEALDMSPAQLQTFVEKYSARFDRLREKLPPETAARLFTGKATLSQGQVESGRGTEAGLEARGSETLAPDPSAKLREERIKAVSPEYRKEVEAYFRAISEGATSQPSPQNAP